MANDKTSDQARRDREALLEAHWASEAKAARKQKLLVGAGAVAAVALVGSLQWAVTTPAPGSIAGFTQKKYPKRTLCTLLNTVLSGLPTIPRL